ncbi:MAG: M20/M25/M40 family metallo-hydrolase [Cyclobacteriaceae bacterium]|nr:M20/M25/M40 family metallo-hydrolase [Cyclobacteriaceae bacterium]
MPAAMGNKAGSFDVRLLKTLCEIHAPSGEEHRMKAFLLDYVRKNQRKWKCKPQIISGDDFQDCLLLRFGKPRTAVFSHMDSIGFTVRYFNQLLPIGSPEAEAGTQLTGRDSLGDIVCELDYDHEHHALYRFGRSIERGTSLVYKVDFKEDRNFIQSAYLDNRLGVLNALALAETLTDGLVVFSCWEEHGGGSVGYLARYLYEEWSIHQALISDITWCSDGVAPGKGVVISLRDRNIPRKTFVDRIINIAQKYRVPFQLEVEGEGSSDGGELQRSPYPIDWCFVGAPQQFAHTPHEKVHKEDIRSMMALYRALMNEL